MRRELPVNIDTKIRTYSYYAYTHSVISAKERVGNVAAKFQILGFEKEEWITDTPCLIHGGEGEFQFVADNTFLENLNGCIYRKVKFDDFVHIRIDYQQYSHPWGAINLFLTDLDEESIMDDDSYLCRLGNFNRDGVYFRCHNVKQELGSIHYAEPLELLLHKNGDCVEAYVGERTGKLRCVCKMKFKQNCKNDLKIGVQVKQNFNTYYNWLYANHIQITWNLEEECPIEFFYGIMKDWNYNVVNYFLNYNDMDIIYVEKFGVIPFVRHCINEGKYIELMLDQYYVNGRGEYKCYHFYHQNLIYGYDDNTKEVLLVGYSDNGLLVKTTISYSYVKTMIKMKGSLEKVCVIEYMQDGFAFECYTNYMLEMIRQYLEAENSSFYLSSIVPESLRVFGIKVYDELLTEKGFLTFISDRRVSHLLYEHKISMKERIEFLYFKGVISEEDIELLLLQMDEIIRISLLLRNLTIKFSMSQDERILSRLKEKIILIKEKEEVCLKQLLCKSGYNSR